ncbi:MAG: glycosyltransferase family 1 protein [Chitinophagaceae bacterium]|nr:glycosyltransferase family 1 protein [Chitinophagaceae bacterium]
MRRLTIGILGTRGIPNHYGGFEQFAQYLSLGLTQRGHDVYVYSSGNHPYKQNEWNDVQIIHCKDPEPKLGTFGQFFYDLNCVNDSRKRNFDVLLHLGYTSDSIWHWRWPKNTVNIVNMDGMEWNRSKYNKPTQKFLKWAESLAAKNAQVLVADSPHMQEYLASTYGKRAVYIPYGAEVFTDTDLSVFRKYKLTPNQYFLLVARMEPENNIEMTIQGYLASNNPYPLLIIGDTGNPFGKHLRSKYHNASIHFYGSVYDQPELNNLRFYSTKYFHGHSVGGTNPSLLEAMGCGCDIAAHDNVFNNAILQGDADYFSSAQDVARIINKPAMANIIMHRKQSNIEKINTIYNQEKNINDYEQLMFMAVSKDIRLNKRFTLSPPLYQTAEKSW